VREVAGGYLKDHPLDDQGQAHVQMMRLEVEAERLKEGYSTGFKNHHL